MKFAFFQSSGTSPNCHDLSKMIVRSLMTSARSLSIHGCILSRSILQINLREIELNLPENTLSCVKWLAAPWPTGYNFWKLKATAENLLWYMSNVTCMNRKHKPNLRRRRVKIHLTRKIRRGTILLKINILF